MLLPQRLKELRNSKGLSQSALADILGRTQQAIGKWEVGKAEPDAPTLLKLATYFNVTIDYLLGRTNNPRSFPKKLPYDITGKSDSPAAARPQPPLQPDTLTPEEAALVEAYRNANDRDKSIVDTILKPEVRAQSEAVEETPMNTAERIGQKIINASPETQARVNAIIQEDVG